MTDLDPELQSAFIGALQTEIGVLKSNVMLRDLQIDALQRRAQAMLDDQQRRIETDAALIDALKERCRAAEAGNAELKAQIRRDQKAER